MNFTNKKAAMFGLDARITLMIFGIISIIVSANIYRVLTEINVDKILAESSSIGSAVDSYHKTMNKSIFDTLTGSLSADDKEKAAFTALYKNENVIAPFNDKWKGPYIKVKYNNGLEPFLNTEYRLLRLAKNASTTCNNINTNPCYVFLKFKDITTEDCDAFEAQTTSTKYGKVYRQAGSACTILVNIAIDY